MAPRSTRFALGALLNITATPIYTVPAGKVVLLRELVLVNNNVLARTATLGINGVGTTALYVARGVAGSSDDHIESRIVATAGETFQGLASGANSIYVSLFGFLFDA